MEIIELKDTIKWGQQRLFSPETWPGKSKTERQFLADQVVDAFHRKMAEIEVDIRWVPRGPALQVKSGTAPSQRKLNSLLEEAYAEAGAASG